MKRRGDGAAAARAIRCGVEVLMVLWGVSSLTGCGQPPCDAAGCEAGEVCTEEGSCQPEAPRVTRVCEDASACEEGERCEEGACVAGCATDASCASDERCEPSSGACVPRPSGCGGGEACAADQVCRVGRCVPREPLQCGELGEACDPARQSREGFVCTRFPGDEVPSCHATCRVQELCEPGLEVDAGGALTQEISYQHLDVERCAVGSICEDSLDGVRACRRSQCHDPVLGRERCKALASASPGLFPLGASCERVFATQSHVVERGDSVRISATDSAFMCRPAGKLKRGERGCLASAAGGVMFAPPRCEVGLMCTRGLPARSLIGGVDDGVCERPCNTDAQCGQGERCLGHDTGLFDGVGICGVACEPYQVDDSCGPERKCLTLSRDEGICTEALGAPGSAGLYGACQRDASCPSGTICKYGRCRPQCDPSARNPEQADATCFDDGGARPGFCLDENRGVSGATRAGEGVCFQRCAASDFGVAGRCASSEDQCAPLFGDDRAACNPQSVGTSQLGAACRPSPTTFSEVCGLGLFCDERGANSGVCRSYCAPEGALPREDLAGCQAGETCMPLDEVEGLGECRLACKPEAPGVLRDTTHCPEEQQGCFELDGQRHCSASGALAVGARCDGASTTARCEAGAVCARDILAPASGFEALEQSFTEPGSRETETCRALCRPFLPSGESDCEEGFACNPVMPFQELNTNTGVCLPRAASTIGVQDPRRCEADEVGRLCGDGAFCVLEEAYAREGMCVASASCLQLCDPATALGCGPEQACGQLGSIDAPSYFAGVYGICRDR